MRQNRFIQRAQILMFGFMSALAMILVSIAALTWSAASQPAPSPFGRVLPDTPEEIAFWTERDKIKSGGEHYQPLMAVFDEPGVNQPPLVSVLDVDLPDSTPVVGIKINGEPCAFVVEQMTDVDRHIVNLIMNSTSISVTYCDLADCVRVVKGEDPESLNPLRVGGLDVNKQLVFLINGMRYGQESTELPLKDYPFSRTSLGDWRMANPRSLIYVGP